MRGKSIRLLLTSVLVPGGPLGQLLGKSPHQLWELSGSLVCAHHGASHGRAGTCVRERREDLTAPYPFTPPGPQKALGSPSLN